MHYNLPIRTQTEEEVKKTVPCAQAKAKSNLYMKNLFNKSAQQLLFNAKKNQYLNVVKFANQAYIAAPDPVKRVKLSAPVRVTIPAPSHAATSRKKGCDGIVHPKGPYVIYTDEVPVSHLSSQQK